MLECQPVNQSILIANLQASNQALLAELRASQATSDIAIRAAQQAAEIIKVRDQTIADLKEALATAKTDALAEWGLA